MFPSVWKHSLTAWLSPESRILTISFLKCESSTARILSPLCYTGTVFCNGGFFGQWLRTSSTLLSSSWNDVSILLEHHEACHLSNTACLWAWDRRGVALVQAVDECGDLWKFPQFWEFWCHPHSLPGLQLHGTGCVKRKRNQCERPSSTELVGSGAGVEWEGALHFPPTSIRKSCDANGGRLKGPLCVRSPMKIRCCVTDWYNTLQAGILMTNLISFFFFVDLLDEVLNVCK